MQPASANAMRMFSRVDAEKCRWGSDNVHLGCMGSDQLPVLLQGNGAWSEYSTTSTTPLRLLHHKVPRGLVFIFPVMFYCVCRPGCSSLPLSPHHICHMCFSCHTKGVSLLGDRLSSLLILRRTGHGNALCNRRSARLTSDTAALS